MKTAREAGLKHLSFAKKTKLHTFENKKGEKLKFMNDKERKGTGILYKNCFLKPVK